VAGVEPCEVVVAVRQGEGNPLVAEFRESAGRLLVDWV
jgi:hypothetical protein